nr:DUF2442 domain-containing protein [Thiocapsa sp.]
MIIGKNCWITGIVPSDSSHSSRSKGQIVIKLNEAQYLGDGRIALVFSDGSQGIFDVRAYCAARRGPLLQPLESEAYVKRFIIDAGALGWPNGLELSPERLYELSRQDVAA